MAEMSRVRIFVRQTIFKKVNKAKSPDRKKIILHLEIRFSLSVKKDGRVRPFYFFWLNNHWLKEKRGSRIM